MSRSFQFRRLDSAGGKALTQMIRLNLQPLENRVGDSFRKGLRDLGAHLFQDLGRLVKDVDDDWAHPGQAAMLGRLKPETAFDLGEPLMTVLAQDSHGHGYLLLVVVGSDSICESAAWDRPQ